MLPADVADEATLAAPKPLVGALEMPGLLVLPLPVPFCADVPAGGLLAEEPLTPKAAFWLVPMSAKLLSGTWLAGGTLAESADAVAESQWDATCSALGTGLLLGAEAAELLLPTVAMPGPEPLMIGALLVPR